MTDTPDGTTRLSDARMWLREQARDGGATCPCCHQFAKVYRRKLTATTARSLIKMWRHRNDPRPDAWLHLPTLLGGKQADEAKARYWGLIEQAPDLIRDDGSPRTGWWRLTDRGRLFVLGEIPVWKYVLIYDGLCLGPDGIETVTIGDVLGTRFSYDDLMVGA